MSRIEFSDLQRYALGAAVAATLGAAVDPATQSVSVSGPLVELLSRIGRGEATVLPLRQVGHDEWLIAGATRRDLDAALAAVSRFIAPTYVEHEGVYPSLREFDPGDDNLGRLARAVYPAGYYTLRSPSTHFKTILERLGRWAHLEAARPQLQETRSPSYRDLYDEFSAALAAGA